MKLQITSFVVGLAVLGGSNAKPMDTCSAQQHCMTFSMTKSTTNTCGVGGEWWVCVDLLMTGAKGCPTSISHTCDKNLGGMDCSTNQTLGFKGMYENLGPTNNGVTATTLCQIAGPNTVVEFLIKDGGGCGGPGGGTATIPVTDRMNPLGFDATCAPRPLSTSSCTGNGEGKECIWTIMTPPSFSSPSTSPVMPLPSSSPVAPPTNVVPIPAPTSPIPAPTPGVKGDPHFKTWKGEKYDFHGVCDLVLLQNPKFSNNLGMDIHIRTRKTQQWSYVSAAAVRIGKDTLEVLGGKDEVKYFFNKNRGEDLIDGDILPQSLSGFPIRFHKISDRSIEFVIDLGNEEIIRISTWNSYVSVNIDGAKEDNFGSSLGLMGTFGDGLKVGRDNRVVLKDVMEFGQEWQVQQSEPKLFHRVMGPQAPQRCEIPSAEEYRHRRLGETKISIREAEIACSRVDEADRELCVFDVMATNDKEVAGAY